jgi:hypothetical protein
MSLNVEMEIKQAFTNEARRRELQVKIATLQGELNATASIQKQISSVNVDAGMMLSDLQAQLSALNAGAGMGMTADFGEKTLLTQLLESERKAGAQAVIELIKTNEHATEDEAIAAWEKAAAKATGAELCVQRGRVISLAYRARLAQKRIIVSESWSDFAKWVFETNLNDILSAS